MNSTIQFQSFLFGAPSSAKDIPVKNQNQQTHRSIFSDLIHLTPFFGTALAHNKVQSFLAQKTISYFADPLTNYFINVPISALSGVVLSTAICALSKLLGEEPALNQKDAITKSIIWSAIFNSAAAIGTYALMTSTCSNVLTAALFTQIGPIATEAVLALTSAGLSTAFYFLAKEMSSN